MSNVMLIDGKILKKPAEIAKLRAEPQPPKTQHIMLSRNVSGSSHGLDRFKALIFSSNEYFCCLSSVSMASYKKWLSCLF